MELSKLHVLDGRIWLTLCGEGPCPIQKAIDARKFPIYFFGFELCAIVFKLDRNWELRKSILSNSDRFRLH